jgi:methylmalonyl-CoA/ethylmalonyl-CoA epimerase
LPFSRAAAFACSWRCRPTRSSSVSVLYFTVDDIAAAYADLRDRGVAFRGEPHLIARMPDHELWMAFFDDGEGNTLALMHEKR